MLNHIYNTQSSTTNPTISFRICSTLKKDPVHIRSFSAFHPKPLPQLLLPPPPCVPLFLPLSEAGLEVLCHECQQTWCLGCLDGLDPLKIFTFHGHFDVGEEPEVTWMGRMMAGMEFGRWMLYYHLYLPWQCIWYFSEWLFLPHKMKSPSCYGHKKMILKINYSHQKYSPPPPLFSVIQINFLSSTCFVLMKIFSYLQEETWILLTI